MEHHAHAKPSKLRFSKYPKNNHFLLALTGNPESRKTSGGAETGKRKEDTGRKREGDGKRMTEMKKGEKKRKKMFYKERKTVKERHK